MPSTVAQENERTPILERLGIRFFEHRNRKLPPVVCDDEIQYLNPNERMALRRIQRGAILRAGLAGAVSGLASAVAEIYASPILGVEGSQTSVEQRISFWSIVLGVTLIATCIEIGFLYWDGLRSVQNMARAAGVKLFDGDIRERQVLIPLVRAALELPNPNNGVLGIHPYQEVSKLRVIVSTLIYKAKISVTNFLVKMLVRRAMGRAALRTSILPLVAVPVTAAWNAWVMWRVLRQARLRVMGPFAAREFLDVIIEDATKISEAGRLSIVRAVGVAVVRKRDMHPNLTALLSQTLERMAIVEPDEENLSDWRLFLDDLVGLPKGEQVMAMQVLAVAIIIDGRRGTREVDVLRQAHERTGRELSMRALQRVSRCYLRGDVLDRDLLQQIAAG